MRRSCPGAARPAPWSCDPGNGSTARSRSRRRRARRRPAGPRRWRLIRSRSRPAGPIRRRSSSLSAAGAAPSPISSRPYHVPVGRGTVKHRRDLPQARRRSPPAAATVNLTRDAGQDGGQRRAHAERRRPWAGCAARPGEKPRRLQELLHDSAQQPEDPGFSTEAATGHRMAHGPPADKEAENKAGQPGPDHLRGGPAPGRSFDDCPQQQAKAGDRQHRPRDRAGGRVLRVGHQHQGACERGDQDRDVDEKH